jgi:hypothetical protein
MLLAAVVSGIVGPLPAIAVALLVPGLPGAAATALGWAGIVLFPLVFAAIHWATFGRRRWMALELLIWAGRFAVARYAAATRLRNPADREGAASWLALHPHLEGEPDETTYWRAYILLVLGRGTEARAELANLPSSPAWDWDRTTLTAQIQLAEALPVDVAELESRVAAITSPEPRAVAAVELGALRSQVAWTCSADDVAPVLAAAPLVEGRAARTLLRHYWLPLLATTAAAWAALTLVLSLLG